MRALDVIIDAYERCNRLSPGETLAADDAAFGFRKLNLLIDEMSASPAFLFRSVITSAAQTGAITLGTGAWAAIAPGTPIVSMTVSDWPIEPVTMQEFNFVYQSGTVGEPRFYAPDGLSTVNLYPVPNGQIIAMQTRVTASVFADQTTQYTVPRGYEAYLGAALAVRIAPALIGRLPSELVRSETACKISVTRLDPAIIHSSYARTGNIINGW